MAVPKQHRSKSRQGQRRMHIHLNVPKLVSCAHCRKAVFPHIICSYCGYYKEREVVDVTAKLSKKERAQRQKGTKTKI